MQVKIYVVLPLVGLLIFWVLMSKGCVGPIATELLNEKSELAKPVLVLSTSPEKSNKFRKSFEIEYSGKYIGHFFTKLEDKRAKRYEMPEKNSKIAGEILIYGSGIEYAKYSFNIDFTPTTIGKGLFEIRAPQKLPLNKKLMFEIVFSDVSGSFHELYSSITFIVKRQGVFYD